MVASFRGDNESAKLSSVLKASNGNALLSLPACGPRVEQLESRLMLSAASQAMANLNPPLFIENQGQWADAQVRFACQGNAGAVLITDRGPVFQAPAAGAPGAAADASAPFSVTFGGANAVQPIGMDRSPTVFNYLMGSPNNSHTGVSAYESVEYPGLYPGIDLRVWSRSNGLKYEFDVQPGADDQNIRIDYQAVQGLSLNADGSLDLQTPLGQLVEKAPYVYQEVNGARQAVSASFVLMGGSSVGFAIGAHDASRPLVIDPDLAWLTYVGGSSFDTASDVATDAGGSVYVTGATQSADLATTGAADQTFNGYWDAFVAKISPDGSQLEYYTYIGGANLDAGTAIAVDASGNAYITGYTRSTGLGTPGTVHSAFMGTDDAFAAKLDPSGTHMLYFTYLGGDDSDHGLDIAVDGAGRAYIVGQTQSEGLGTSGAYDPNYNGGLDAFVLRLNPSASAIQYFTYLGGSGSDYASGVKVNAAGEAYVTGLTSQDGLATSGAYDTALNGTSDAFVAKFSASGSALEYFTYLGGSASDSGNDIAIDSAGAAFVTGWTRSAGIATAGAYDSTLAGPTDAFVAKIDPTGGSLDYLTYLGASGYDSGSRIAVTSDGKAVIVGDTDTSGLATADAFQAICKGSTDAFIAQLDASGASLLYYTYVGGSGEDHGLGVAVDPSDNIVAVGVCSAGGLATTGAYDTVFAGASDGFVVKLAPAALTQTAAVIGTHIFYNNSSFDGYDPAASAADDAAIDPALVLFSPGETPGTHNISGSSKGINGLMIDISNLADPGDLNLANIATYFQFSISTDLTVWTDAPAPSIVATRPNQVDLGATRITLIWPDGRLVKRWLKVTALANAYTGLKAEGAFCIGSNPGDANGTGIVDVSDYSIWFNNYGHGQLPSQGDFDCSGMVDVGDYSVWFNNYGSSLSLGTGAGGTAAGAAEAAAASAIPNGVPETTAPTIAAAILPKSPQPSVEPAIIRLIRTKALLASGGAPFQGEVQRPLSLQSVRHPGPGELYEDVLDMQVLSPMKVSL